MEKWKDIEGLEGCYQVNDIGQVKSLPRMTVSKMGWIKPVKGGMLRPIIDGVGYIVYSVSFNGVIWRIWAHRVVVEAFIRKIPKGMQVNHKDGIKTNNHFSNLEIVTPSENIIHSYKVLGNKAATGEKHGFAKLNNQSVLEIRNKYVPQKHTIKQLAEEYGVSKTAIQGVVSGKYWK